MTLAQMDLRARYEAKHDIAAGAEVAKITKVAALQSVLLWSLASYAQAAQQHALAAAALQDELSDSDRYRIKLQTTRQALWPHYLRVELNVRAALLAPDSDEPLAAAELEERERFIERTFTLSRTTLEREAYEKTWARLDELVRICSSHPLLKPLKLAKGLKSVLDTYGKDLEAWQEDRREDRDAQAALEAARDMLSRAAQVHKQLVSAALHHEARADELGRYIRSADPAYAARRAANAPIEEEEDAGAIDTTQPSPSEDV